jgi:tRNA A-37 threonylcarbamoyl transferase component Bud32
MINAAIIYNKFWMGLVEKNSQILDYLYKQKDEELIIYDTESGDGNTPSLKKNNLKNNRSSESQIDSTRNSQIEKTDNKSITSKRSSDVNSMSNNGKEKKRERRKNPFSQINNNEEEEAKLIDDSSLTKGINYSSFEILECLGSGTFGKVFKVKLKQKGNIYAMKIINKKYLIKNQQLRYAVTECNVLKQAQHPFIINLHFAFQTPDHLYMILDYCPGGDFSYHIARHLFEEDEAKFFIAELILAIEHLHNMDIIYRDLKPDNILIDSQGHIKLADFGLAKENVSDNKIAQSFCGSPAYLTPEMVNRKGVGKAADIYGVGAVLYEMMSGTPPFYAHDLSTMYKNISNNNLWFHDYFSEELKDLLRVKIFINF